MLNQLSNTRLGWLTSGPRKIFKQGDTDHQPEQKETQGQTTRQTRLLNTRIQDTSLHYYMLVCLFSISCYESCATYISAAYLYLVLLLSVDDIRSFLMSTIDVNNIELSRPRPSIKACTSAFFDPKSYRHKFISRPQLGIK